MVRSDFRFNLVYSSNMETGVGENNRSGDSSTFVSKSMGSLVKIDAISIDLGIAAEKNETGKCQHFSIRGYVAEMRQKDGKICSPFASDGDHSNYEEHTSMLPPLYAPKFRWWHCQNCLQDIGTMSASEEIGVVSEFFKGELISSGTYSHVSSHVDAATEQSDLQQASKLDSVDGSRTSINTSTNMTGDEYCLSSCIYKKGKSAEVGDISVIGHGNGLEENMKQEIGNPTCDFTRLDVQERQTDGTVDPKYKSSGSGDISRPNCGNHDAFDVGPGIEFPKRTGSISAEICLAGKKNSADDEQRNVSKACLTSDLVGKIGETINADKDQATGLPCELEECNNVSSESDEVLAGNRIFAQENENSSGFPRRKNRKVRLLTELLGGKGNGENYHRKTEGPSNGIPEASAGLGSLFAPEGQVPLHENIRKVSGGPQEKRKMHEDQEMWKPLEISCPSNLSKKVRIFEGDVKTSMTIEISDAESEEDASARVGLQTGVKRQRTKHVSDKSPNLGKTKSKQTQINDEYSPMVPWAETPRINHNGIGDVDKCAVAADASFLKSAHDALMGRGMEPYLRSYIAPQQIERKSSLSKKKSKMPQVEDGKDSLMSPSKSILGECSIKRKDVKFMPTGSEKVNLQSAHDVSVKMGLDLSLNSFIAAGPNDKNISAHTGDKIDPLLIQQKGMHFKDVRRKDGMYVGESSLFRKSALDPSLGEGLFCDLNERIAHRTAILRAKHNCSSLLKEGTFPLHQNLGSSGLCNNDKIIQIQRHSEVEKHYDQRADKVFEQGTSDDIPMEIVELMAKNQYERGLYEGGQNYCLSERTNNKMNAEIMGFPEVHGSEAIRSLQKEQAGMGKSPFGNPRTGMMTTVESAGAINSNPVNFCHVNRNYFNKDQAVDNPAFTMFSAFGQTQQILENGVHFSASGSIRNNNVQNREWNGEKMAQRSFLTKARAYNPCHSSSKQKESAEYMWSSMTPNGMMFGTKISPKDAMQSSNAEVRVQHLNPLHKGKMITDFDFNSFSLNTPSEEKQSKSFDFESFKRTPSEYPFIPKHGRSEINPKAIRSLDPYSNETIPAMQLLSLMDAAKPSSTPFGVDAKKILEKPFSPCSYHPKVRMDGNRDILEKPFFPYHRHSKEFSGLGPGVFKTSDSLRHLSSGLYGKSQLEKSCECPPAVPSVAPFASASQKNVDFKRAASFTGQISFKSQEQESAKAPYSPRQNRGGKSQKAKFPSISHAVCDPNSGEDKQKGISGGSCSMVFAFQCRGLEDSTKCFDLEAPSMCGTVWPLKSISKNDICSVNRNPADFSIPEAGNMYTISGEDLNFGKKNRSKKVKSASINVDGRKRQRAMKLTAVKKHAQHRI